jgi:hypothetical protein
MIAVQTLQPLQGERLLAAWDQAQAESDLQRALTLLGFALPLVGREELSELPLPERNRLLLQLRTRSFGSMIEGFARCDACGGSLEFRCTVAELCRQLPDGPDSTQIEWQEHGRPLRLRAVSSSDLLAALELPADAAEEFLLARCLSAHDDQPEVLQVRQQFERLHALSELRCTLHCPHCCGSTSLELDIAHFLWLEVRHAAHRLLADIHTLAYHYGWSERSIARMSAARREAYLQFVTARPDA